MQFAIRNLCPSGCQYYQYYRKKCMHTCAVDLVAADRHTSGSRQNDRRIMAALWRRNTRWVRCHLLVLAPHKRIARNYCPFTLNPVRSERRCRAVRRIVSSNRSISNFAGTPYPRCINFRIPWQAGICSCENHVCALTRPGHWVSMQFTVRNLCSSGCQHYQSTVPT